MTTTPAETTSGVPAGTTVALVTLGCARNEVDSEELAGRLQADGFVLVEDPEDAETVRALVAKGSFGGGVFDTDDCRGTFEELSAKGVTFLREPVERPYGVEALFRDDSGNWFSLTESKWAAGSEWAG